jgi:hypothetical protein
MATKTLRVFAEYTSTGFVPMPTLGNIDYGYTLGSTFPATTPTSFQTDNPDLVVTVTTMTDFYVWIRINGTAWNPSYTRNVRVYPDSPNINNVVMNMIIATGPAGVSSYTQIVQTSNRLYFNGATTDAVYDSKFAGKTYINELNFGTAPGLATVATSGAYADLTGKPSLATVATSGLFTDLSSKPSGTAPLSYNSGTNSFVITQANTSTNGFLSSTDWNTFNNKQGTITLTTSGTSGASTFVGNTLNIPNYAPNLSVYVPYTGATTNVNLGTHSLTAADLVVNHVSGSGVAASITKGGSGEALTVVKTSGSGNAASITGGVTLLDELHLNTDLVDAYIASATNWNTAYTNRITSLTLNGSSGTATLASNVLNIPSYTLVGLGGQPALNGTGFVKISGTTISYDNSTYLTTANASSTYQTIITNPVTGTGTINELAYFNSASSIASLAVATYPSLTELAYVKGVTSAIQTQLDAKASTLSGTTNYIPKFTSSSAIGNSLIFDNGTNVGIGTTTLSASTNYRALNINGTTGSEIYLKGSSVDYGYIYANSGAVVLATQTAIPLNLQTNATTRLSISSTGASTFTSSAGEPIVINSTNATVLNTSYKYNNGTQLGYIGTGQGLINGGGSTIFAMRSENSMAFSVNGGNIAINIASNKTVEIKGVGANSDGLVVFYGGTSTASFKFSQGGSNAIFNGFNSSGTNTYSFHTFGHSFINNSANFSIGSSSDAGYKLYVVGTIYATGNITANSDLTLKKNLKLIDNPIDKLMALNGYAYQWKSDDSHQYGVIAQEVEKILPYAVSTGNDGIKGVSYNQLTPLLIEGFKSHESEITILKARVKYLESKLA